MDIGGFQLTRVPDDFFDDLLARFAKLELNGPPERERRVRFRGFRKLPVRVQV